MAGRYQVAVKVYDTDGSTPMSNLKVTLRQENTNESLILNTNTAGEAVFNLTNLPSGFEIGHKITIYTLYQSYESSKSHTITSGGGVTLTLTLVALPSAPTLRYYAPQDFLDYFNFKVYDEDAENGIKMQQLVKIGEMVEGGIDNDTGTKFDDNDGSYYTITDEYHDAETGQSMFFLKKTPVVSLTSFLVNTADEDGTPSWDALTEASYEIELDKDSGRVTINDSADYPERGNNQVKATYTYGRATPLDIKELAILETGVRMFGASFIRSKIGDKADARMNDTEWFNTYRDRIITRYNTTGIDSIFGGA